MNDGDNRQTPEERLKNVEEAIRGLAARIEKVENRLGVEKRAASEAPSVSEEAISSEPSRPADPRPVSPPPLPRSVPGVLEPKRIFPSEAPAPAGELRPGEGRRDPAGADWREVLRQWQLWPPEGEGSVEVQVGAWWATRIGALLAVIGVVFFGVYVAQHTAPWIRFAQLCAIVLGTVGAGHWLEKRNQRFGTVVFSAGLALAFFAAFAGHALPAVRVIENVVVAGFAQGIVVAGIVACALWKNRAPLATLAVAFGFVTCFFSFGAGLHDFGLVAGGLLAAGAAGLFLRRGWTAPFVISVPLAYLLGGVVIQFAWTVQTAPVFPLLAAPPVGYFVLFGVSDWAARRRGAEYPLAQRRFVLGVNLAGAMATGFWAMRRFAPGELEWFYLAMAALAGGLSFACSRVNAKDEAVHAYFAAASALLALFFVETLDARTRWLALGIQSMVTLMALRRTRLRSAEGMMVLVWAGSAGLFFLDTARAGYFAEPGGILSGWGLAAAWYLVLSAVLLGLQGRWLETAAMFWQGNADELSEDERRENRRIWNGGLAFVLGLVATGIAFAGFEEIWLPAGALGLAVLLVAAGVLAGHWIPVGASVLPFAAGQAAFWTTNFQGAAEWVVWANGLVAAGLAFGALVVFHRPVFEGRVSERGRMLAASGLAVSGIVSVLVTIANLANAELFFLSAGIVGLAVLAAASRLEVRYLADVAWVAVFLGVCGPPAVWIGGWPLFSGDGPAWLWWAGAATAIAVAVLYDCWPAVSSRKSWMARVPFFNVLPAILAVLAVLYPVGEHIPEIPAPAATIVFGSILAVLGWRPGWRHSAWTAGSVFFLGFGAGLIVTETEAGAFPVAVAIVLAVAAAAYVVGLSRFSSAGISAKRGWGGAVSIGALGMLFLIALGRQEPALSYATVFWGISAAAMLAVGVAFRVPSLRIVGLIGLALCVPRAFLVDIHSTFYRIAAFASLGVALLAVGFSYHRFRHLISPEEGKERE